MKLKNLNFLLVSIILLCSVLSINAQNNNRGQILREKVRSQKIAYLSAKLELTEDEAIRFWPIYNQYEKELDVIKVNLAQDAVFRNMSEAEAEQNLNSIIDFKQKELDIDKKYLTKFRSVLSATKVLRLFHYDKEFRRELAEVVRKRVDKRKNK